MNRNGFTLVELLATLIIIGLLSFVIIPNVTNIINENNNKIYERQIENIITSAKTWGADNIKYLPTINNESITITLGQLQQGGYANKNLKNPKTKELFDQNNTYVIIRNVNGLLTYEVFVEQE